ncbi:hypothetical protein QTO30_07355 [Yoonia sp. GPGPB17]|uniref:hypothetical protein n=1 Tax=Yoonia sp. GPGPB17 TaxID=3026147 RepID=UPI0030C0044F
MTKKITKITVDDDGGMNDFWEQVDAVGRTKITIQKDGRPTALSIEEAVLQKLAASALSGSIQSIRQFNELQRLAAEHKQREINRSVTTWRAIREAQRKRYVAHRREHGTEPRSFPHPDDIMIDERTGVQIIGPIDEDEYNDMRRTKRVIDVCLWQDALERPIRDDDSPTGGLLLAMLLNECLPRRERLSDADMMRKVMRREVMSKRQVLKEARQAWLDAGHVVKRGATFWSADTIVSLIKMLPDAARICGSDKLDEDAQLQALQNMIRQRVMCADD